MADEQKKNDKIDNNDAKQDDDDREVTCAVMVEFAERGSAQLIPRLIGEVTSTQILLAASYLKLMADRQIHELWTARATADAQRKIKQQADMARVKRMLDKDGEP